MDFRQVRYFLAVAELESFRRASEHLRVAQSALSRHVSDLERRVGAPLFERLPKGVRLSPAGLAFQREAEQALQGMEHAFDRARRAAAGEIGGLRLGMNDLAARSFVVASRIRRFRSAQPGVDLEVLSMTSADQVRALQTGKLDAGLIIERPDGAGLNHLTVADDPFELAAPRGHRLAERVSIAMAELVDEPFVAVRTSSYWLPQTRLLARCRELGLMPRIVQEAGTEQMQVCFIRAGLGVGFVNRSLRDTLPSDVVLRPVEGLDVSLRLDLVWPRTAPAPAIRALAEAFREPADAGH